MLTAQESTPRHHTAGGLRPTWAEIDLEAVRNNVRVVRHRVGAHRRIMAVVKSDAYGHGMPQVAQAAKEAGADAFGVATGDEALELRETAGFEEDLILVMAPSMPEEAQALQHAAVSIAIGTVPLLRHHLAVAWKRGMPARLHMQIDTGIGRDGVRFDDRSFLDDLRGPAGANLEGLFTHFAVADSFDPADIAFTEQQQELFDDVVAQARAEGHHFLAHSANSGAILRHPHTHGDMVRPGIMLYGADPTGRLPHEFPLRPVVTLKSRIATIKTMQPGDTISYGRQFTVPTTRPIGVVPVGYGDGYMRSLSGKGHVLVHGHRVPIRGRVCMDQIMIDLSEVPDAREGDEVVLYGGQGHERIWLEEAAELAGTIPYELTCHLTQRVPRRYVG